MLIHHLIWIWTGSGDCSDHLGWIRTVSVDKLFNDHLTRVLKNRNEHKSHLFTQNITQEHMVNETTYKLYAKPNTTQEKKKAQDKTAW